MNVSVFFDPSHQSLSDLSVQPSYALPTRFAQAWEKSGKVDVVYGWEPPSVLDAYLAHSREYVGSCFHSQRLPMRSPRQADVHRSLLWAVAAESEAIRYALDSRGGHALTPVTYGDVAEFSAPSGYGLLNSAVVSACIAANEAAPSSRILVVDTAVESSVEKLLRQVPSVAPRSNRIDYTNLGLWGALQAPRAERRTQISRYLACVPANIESVLSTGKTPVVVLYRASSDLAVLGLASVGDLARRDRAVFEACQRHGIRVACSPPSLSMGASDIVLANDVALRYGQVLLEAFSECLSHD